MSELHTFLSLVVSQILLLILFSAYAVYMVDLNCPTLPEVQSSFESIPYNQSNILTTSGNVWATLGFLFSGCSGIPWYIYIVIFVPAIIAIVVYVVPFIGN